MENSKKNKSAPRVVGASVGDDDGNSDNDGAKLAFPVDPADGDGEAV